MIVDAAIIPSLVHLVRRNRVLVADGLLDYHPVASAEAGSPLDRKVCRPDFTPVYTNRRFSGRVLQAICNPERTLPLWPSLPKAAFPISRFL